MNQGLSQEDKARGEEEIASHVEGKSYLLAYHPELVALHSADGTPCLPKGLIPLCYLRYASDPGAFPFMQNVRFSHRQTPLRVYEEATCFRNEQEGEVSGLKRVRNFMMTDMHAACADVPEARAEFEGLCLRFAELMNDIIARGRWVLGWEVTVDFFERNRDWLIGIGSRMGVPAFFKQEPLPPHDITFQVADEELDQVFNF